MTSSHVSVPAPSSTEAAAIGDESISQEPQGMRKNGKQWHEPKKAFRPKAGNSGWEKRQVERAAMTAVKAKEKEMIATKEAARQELIAKIREKKERKAERERFEKLAETMHKKRIERLKRKEKRNKMIKS